MKILVIDIGGTHIKLLASGQEEPRSFDSGKGLTAGEFTRRAKSVAQGWDYDAVSMGFPGLVGKGGPVAEPENLGGGWVGFDFAKVFGKPVKVMNDAAMQALGSYRGGRMLFLGLGTGVGTTLIASKVIVPLEVGQMPYRDATITEYLGKEGFERLGEQKWAEAVVEVVKILKGAFVADHVVLGGGRAELIGSLPEGILRGDNAKAFEGGFRLWETEVAHADQAPGPEVWRVVG